MKTEQAKRKHEQFRSLAKEFSPEELMEIMEPYWRELGCDFENPYKQLNKYKEKNEFLEMRIKNEIDGRSDSPF